MSRLRGLIAFAIVVATAAAVPATADSVRALAGVTTFVASKPVWADVQVSRAATFRTPFGESPDVTVSGGGRMTAFVLVGTGRDNAAVTIAGGAAHGERFLFPLRQHPAPAAGTFETVKTYPDVVTIPRGSYRLYVVPGGSRVTITLRLHGLPGRATIAPATAADAEVATPDAGAVESPARNTFVGSTTRTLPRRGLALQSLRTRLEISAAWQLVMCHRPSASKDDPLNGGPGCPSADDRTLVNHRAPDVVSDAKFFVHGYAGLPAGWHGLGTYFMSQGYASQTEYASLWLTY